MRKVLVILAGFSTVLVAACAPYLPRYRSATDAVATGFYEDRSAPGLALLEYRLGKYFALRERPYEVVCAALVDPSAAPGNRSTVPLPPETEQRLMKRFPGLSPSSRCERRGIDVTAVDTGVKAAIFDVHELSCDGVGTCSAWGGYYANGPHGWSWYWIEWKKGEWHIRPRDLGIVLT